MHETHEYFAFRNRLFEFLVEEMGFTAIGLETGYSESVAADDYVLGRAEASDAACTSVFSWSDAPILEKPAAAGLDACLQRATHHARFASMGSTLPVAAAAACFPNPARRWTMCSPISHGSTRLSQAI